MQFFGYEINVYFLISFVLIIILLAVLIPCVKIVPQAHSYVVERLGAYHQTWHTGLHFRVPFIDKISKRIVLKERVADFPPQPVITKDNVTMQIDTIVYYQIMDAKLFTYGVDYPIKAIENLTATTLRNIIGELELDETLTSRDVINVKMRSILDEATDAWGIKINRVEVRNIIPPHDIQEAMEKQMRAERERRETMLRAEGEKKSAILIAEGRKQSRILEAEAAKEAAILEAEATKEALIRTAQGEAEAILEVQKAYAEGVRMLNEASPSKAVLTIKSLQTMEKVADGQATKIIIPSELQGIAGLASALTGIVQETKKDNE